MSEIKVVRKEDLRQGPATPGITREIAFEGTDALFLHSTAARGSVSGWHHHGEHNIYGYLISGTLRFEYGQGWKEFVEIKAGEHFHVSPGLIHRDVNPDTRAQQEAVIAITGSGPLVVTVEGPE